MREPFDFTCDIFSGPETPFPGVLRGEKAALSSLRRKQLKTYVQHLREMVEIKIGEAMDVRGSKDSIGNEHESDGRFGTCGTKKRGKNKEMKGEKTEISTSLVVSGITPLHALPAHVRDDKKIRTITQSMKENGWIGDPVIIVKDAGKMTAWNATHRLQAAKKAKLTNVPVLVIDAKILSAAGPIHPVEGLHGGTDEDRLVKLENAGCEAACEVMRREIGNRKNEAVKHLEEKISSFDDRVRQDPGNFGTREEAEAKIREIYKRNDGSGSPSLDDCMMDIFYGPITSDDRLEAAKAIYALRTGLYLVACVNQRTS